MTEERSRLLLAYVALNSPRTPTQDQVISLMRTKYAADPLPTAGGTSEISVFFDLPEGMAFFGQMPGPIPWGDLEWPCQMAFWWPDAEKVLRKHTHHLIVSLADAPGNALERHIWLTKFVAALAESSDAAGIYWGSGSVVHSPEMFCAQAAAMTDDPCPPLWIDHHIWQEDGAVRFATTGLRAFGIPEIEVDGTTLPPGEVFKFCSNVVTYVLQRGSAIPDGDTLGRSATEKVKVRHAPSMWERDGVVMKLVMK